MNYTQIKSDTIFWITGDSTADVDFTAADQLVSHNEYYNEIGSIIMAADGRWQFDDDNYTTLPIATTDIVSGQGDYEIGAAEFLDLERLEIKDSSANWTVLSPWDKNDNRGTAIAELDETQGTPTYYDKIGNSIILHTIPNYSSTAGLKAYFKRLPSYFVISDTTKTPGFNPLYHRYISLGAALDYCTINSMNDRVNVITAKMQDIRDRVQNDYSKRSADEKTTMRPRRESYGERDSHYSSNYNGDPYRINW